MKGCRCNLQLELHRTITHPIIERAAKFVGIIRIINPEKWHTGALHAAIENLSYLGMGSKKSSGYGELETTIKGVTTKLMREGKWTEEFIEIIFWDRITDQH